MNQRPLTKAESAELRALYDDPVGRIKRFCELRDQCLLYGDSTIEPRALKGLAPRYRSS